MSSSKKQNAHPITRSRCFRLFLSGIDKSRPGQGPSCPVPRVHRLLHRIGLPLPSMSPCEIPRGALRPPAPTQITTREHIDIDTCVLADYTCPRQGRKLWHVSHLAVRFGTCIGALIWYIDWHRNCKRIVVSRNQIHAHANHANQWRDSDVERHARF